MDKLKAKIREAFANIFNVMHLNVWSELEHKLNFLRANNGGNVDSCATMIEQT